MQRSIGLALVLLSMSILSSLLFQNCAVHKTDDKKNFDENGVSQAQQNRSAASSSSAKPSALTISSARSDGRSAFVPQNNTDCRPYLSEAEADTVFGQPITTRMFYDAERDAEICLMSTASNSDNGLDTAVCTVSARYLELLNSPPPNSLADPINADTLGHGAYGIIDRGSPPEVQFLGAEEGSVRGVQCHFSFASQENLDQHRGAALLRAAQLVHLIAHRLSLH